MILIFCLFSNYVILATFLTKIRGLEYLSGTMYARLKIILAGSDIILGLSLGEYFYLACFQNSSDEAWLAISEFMM